MDQLHATPAAIAAHARINQTQTAYPSDSTICALWDSVVATNPDATALTGACDPVSYRALDGHANGVAHQLMASGVKAGDVVLVSMDRSAALVTALLAILKVGAAYLPVDKSWPMTRVADLVAQTNVKICIADHGFTLQGVSTLAPDAAPVDTAPQVNITAQATAYINFTSGSTGQPKGVPITHQNVARLISSPSYMSLGAHTKMLHLAPVCFDAATLEIWGPLLNGGTCVLYPSEMLRVSRLRKLLTAHNVNAVFLTTALFNMLIDEDPAVLAQVDCIMTGGEAHSLAHIDTAFRAYGPTKLVSVYGPTESTTFATFYPITRLRHADETALPIGKPIQNTQLFIVADNQLAEPDQIGEVCLAGPGLSAGYLGRDDLTADKFVTVMINGTATRIYRTGDLGYLNADGDTVFQGRSDDQVKVNGNRIELGEVQHHLLAAPNVQNAVVAVTDAQAGAKEVVAFIIAKTAPLDIAALRSALARDVPAFMIPSRIYAVNTFPLSPTGKVDKKALMTATHPTAIAAE